MKRSGQVGLAVMGTAAFVATYASASAYLAKPASVVSQPAQTCTARSDGTQNCEPARRGFAYYLYPRYFYGSSSTSPAEPKRTQTVALTGNTRIATSAPTANGIERGGFGSTVRSVPMRVSAGG